MAILYLEMLRFCLFVVTSDKNKKKAVLNSYMFFFLLCLWKNSHISCLHVGSFDSRVALITHGSFTAQSQFLKRLAVQTNKRICELEQLYWEFICINIQNDAKRWNVIWVCYSSFEKLSFV